MATLCINVLGCSDFVEVDTKSIGIRVITRSWQVLILAVAKYYICDLCYETFFLFVLYFYFLLISIIFYSTPSLTHKLE